MNILRKLYNLGPHGLRGRVCLSLVLFLSLTNCQSGSVANPSTEKKPEVETVALYSYEVVHTWPHDAQAFTQGLVFHDGKLLESTGQIGSSSLRSVELETGKVIRKIDISSPYFAEGITLLGGKIYQLTWQHERGFIYDSESLKRIGEFPYQGEGWGLTNDGQSLILSDGTNRIRFIDPVNFRVTKTIAVSDKGTPVSRINELEYIKGEIFANIWHDDRIARVDGHTGKVVGWVNLQGLLPKNDVDNEEAVLNGIAYDESQDRLFVTGKLWPKLFEIRIKQ